MKAILNRLYNHERLSKSEATQILKDIAAEKYNDAHLASFMTVFMMRPITADELSGFAALISIKQTTAPTATASPSSALRVIIPLISAGNSSISFAVQGNSISETFSFTYS